MGDSENYRIIAVQFIDYRIRKFANDEAPSLVIKLRPAERVPKYKADSAVDFSLKIRCERGATRMDDRTSEASMERRKKEGYF